MFVGVHLARPPPSEGNPARETDHDCGGPSPFTSRLYKRLVRLDSSRLSPAGAPRWSATNSPVAMAVAQSSTLVETSAKSEAAIKAENDKK